MFKPTDIKITRRIVVTVSPSFRIILRLSLIHIIILVFTITSFSQMDSFDLCNYEPPAGCQKETKETIVSYTTTNQSTGGWMRISIIKSTSSKGSMNADFTSEWNELAVKPYKAGTTPQVTDLPDNEGWKARAGAGEFVFDAKPAMIMLTTWSRDSRCVSVVALTNSQAYVETIGRFLGSVRLKNPSEAISNEHAQLQMATCLSRSIYQFNTTNFDDGWTSRMQEDWVEVTRGVVKVLLHYPKDGTSIPAYPEPHVNTAWNILVAPRYTNLRDYKVASPSLDYQRGYLGSGWLTDRSGRDVFVALFSRANTGWIEIICPDKKTFIEAFGIDPATIAWDASTSIWEPFMKLPAYNKFAVAASDFSGTWTSDFTGMQQLYNVYTGQYAGMKTYQSNETFAFMPALKYKWSVMVVNGMAGNSKFTNTKSAGSFEVLNNWKLRFSDIEGKPADYNAYFSCVKGGRLLWLANESIGNYSCFGLKK